MRILVTGGSGTFGRAFIRRALASGLYADGVISYSRDEQKAAAMTAEFGHHAAFKAFLGDVRDSQRLDTALYGVTHVVHAAALKRVDAAAYSPSEVIATNVIGTMNVVDAAIRRGVERVVVISSDKSCMPTNIYGATKMCAEHFATQSNAYGYPRGTRIACVRYGNVLGSRGSVIGIWRQQVRDGLPIGITDRRMTRFIMTIEEATDLVIRALGHMHGGEVFVPKLPSASIVDLATAVAPPDGYPTVDIPMRPGGEKLHESLLNEEEPVRTYERDGCYVVVPSHHDWIKEFPDVGHSMPPTTVYRSDRNTEWLSAAELRRLIAVTEACR